MYYLNRVWLVSGKFKSVNFNRRGGYNGYGDDRFDDEDRCLSDERFNDKNRCLSDEDYVWDGDDMCGINCIF